MTRDFRRFACVERATAIAAALALALSPLLAQVAEADPPPWAPAHGYRAKHGLGYQHLAYYVPPVGIDLGRCNRDLLGGIVGGAAGGLLGSQVGKGSGKVAATIAGTVVGVLVGGSIGRSMDAVDQACVGQVLEQAPAGRSVVWRNPDSAATYRVEPRRIYEAEGRYCREYLAEVTVAGKRETAYGTACRQPDGSWQVI